MSGSLAVGQSLNNTPREVFVTFSNNNTKYLGLLTNVIDSIHHFSRRAIITYGIYVDLNIHDYFEANTLVNWNVDISV